MTVASIASIPSRLPQLVETVNSLYDQVDKIILSLNGYYDGEYFTDHKIEYAITEGTDEQKFRKVEGEYFLTCDDDLIYPPDYVQLCKEKLQQYEIITFHGRRFLSFPVRSYYRDKASKYRCLDKVSDDITVHIGGTGCMAFKPENFFVTLTDFPEKYMADVQLSLAAKRAGKTITCIKHESGWIQYQQVTNTIYDRFKNEDWRQTELANQLF